jgi:hypothetical protein
MRRFLVAFLLVACGSYYSTEPQEPEWEPPPANSSDAVAPTPAPDAGQPEAVGSNPCAPAYCFVLNGELHCLPKLCTEPDFTPPSPKTEL